MALQRAPLSPSFFRSSITRRCSPCETSLSTCLRWRWPPLSCPLSFWFSYSNTTSQTAPAFVGAVFMPPLAAHGLHRGPFFVSDPHYQRHGRATIAGPFVFKICRTPAPTQRPRSAYQRPVLARFNGVLRPVFTPVALLHRQRFYARFWGIVAPHTGIPNAARERLYSS